MHLMDGPPGGKRIWGGGSEEVVIDQYTAVRFVCDRGEAVAFHGHARKGSPQGSSGALPLPQEQGPGVPPARVFWWSMYAGHLAGSGHVGK